MSNALHNYRYDLALRAVLCGTSSGRPVTKSALARLIGDDDLSGFFSYAEASAIGRHFRLLTDERYVSLGMASRAMLSRESPVSNAALAVFLFILKWYNENSLPVARLTIVEQFVSSERSAARTVARALEELERLFWIDQATSDGGSHRYIPTRIGIQSLGPRFLGRVIATSQQREFKPDEVEAFFRAATKPERPSGCPPQVLQSLFDFVSTDPRYERVLRRVIIGTTVGRPPTVASVTKSLGEDSLQGLLSYCSSTGLDRFFSIVEAGAHLVAVVEASRVYKAGLGPVPGSAVALAVYAWHLEKTLGRALTRQDLLHAVKGRVRRPTMHLGQTLSRLLRKGWLRVRGSGRFTLTPAGKQCLTMALHLRTQSDADAILGEIASTHFGPASGIDEAMSDIPAEPSDDIVEESPDDTC